jgi:hypothetical protein
MARQPQESQRLGDNMLGQNANRGTHEVIYSGANIRAYAVIKPWRHETLSDVPPAFFVLGEIATIAYSTYRDTGKVRALGHIAPKNFTMGQRTVAGSIIFTVFNKDPLYKFLTLGKDFGARELSSNQVIPKTIQAGVSGPSMAITQDEDPTFKSQVFRYIQADQLPPFDVHLIHANEEGDMSYMTIRGIKIFTEGRVMSIEDLFTEKTCQYLARDTTPLVPLREHVQLTHGDGSLVDEYYQKPRTFDDLTSGEEAQEILIHTRNVFK